jgi:hypothetical protein
MTVKTAILHWSFLAFAVPILTHANAQTLETPEASTLGKVLSARPANDSTNDPRWRASLADALHRYCERVLMQVPRNTPQEDRWVDSELNDSFGGNIDSLDFERWNERMQRQDERLNRVMNSAENARKSLRHVLSECSSLTKDLVKLEQASPAAEALLWVRLSRYFWNEKEVWRLAEIVGLVSPRLCSDLPQTLALKAPPPGAHDENNICRWGWVHLSILSHAVIPLLEGSSGQ